ncbi:Pre-mRNA cleavage complex II protein Clp1-domain-containing protein [Globomyces pollinis-pini]|nr:Pre-mRNA cleavage complex II protein Clp1-domain-containing protein [Globomyces pollinis-pini]
MKRFNPFESLRNLKAKVPKTIEKIESNEQISTSIVMESHIQTFIDCNSTNSIRSNSSSLLLVKLDRNESLCLHGVVQIAPIIGSFQMLGFKATGNIHDLSPSTKFYNVYSSLSSSLVTVSSTQNVDIQNRDLESVNPELIEEIRLLLKQWDTLDLFTVIALQPTSCGILGIERIHPIFKACFKPTPTTKKNVLVPGSYFVGSEDIHLFPYTSYSNENLNVIGQVIKDANVICVIGNTNTGKSTTTRYLTNELLQNHREVAYLDCDLGQPEFTPCGMLSLTVVKEPLLGPPFTHFKIPYHGIYIGTVTPKADPDSYITALFQLVDMYRNNLSHMPLIVNTSGWTKGVGFDLLIHFLTYVNPTAILSMQHFDGYPIDLSSSETLLSVTHTLQIPQSDTMSSKLHAADHRSLTTSSYFMLESISINPTWDFKVTFSEQQPYRVDFSSIKIKFLNDSLPFSESLIALNGMIVGLVIDSTTYHSNQTQKSPHWGFIPSHTPLQQNCVGQGLIRSIDLQEKYFYICTPVPLQTLCKVNLLVRGTIEVPIGLLTHGHGIRPQVPYTTFMQAGGVGAVELRNRRLGRKKHQVN